MKEAGRHERDPSIIPTPFGKDRLHKTTVVRLCRCLSLGNFQSTVAAWIPSLPATLSCTKFGGFDRFLWQAEPSCEYILVDSTRVNSVSGQASVCSPSPSPSPSWVTCTNVTFAPAFPLLKEKLSSRSQ